MSEPDLENASPLNIQIGENILSFLLAVSGNASLVFLFLQSLLYPAANTAFIANTGLLIFVFEFFSLHAAGMFSGLARSSPAQLAQLQTSLRATSGVNLSAPKLKRILLGIYALFAIGYGAHFHNWIMPGMFLLSCGAKVFGKKASIRPDDKRLTYFILAFLLLVMLVIPVANYLPYIFPTPPLATPHAGLFERTPQALMVWGVLYYSVCIVIEGLLFKKYLAASGFSTAKRHMLFVCVVGVLLVGVFAVVLKSRSASMPAQITMHIPADTAAVHDITSYKVQAVWDYPFNQPRALSIDHNDNIYVAESYKGVGTNSRILKFNNAGTLLGWWGKGQQASGWHTAHSNDAPAGQGTKEGEFTYIFKMGFDRAGTMYVLDRGAYYDLQQAQQTISTDRVQKINMSGEVAPWPAEGLEEPSCLAVVEPYALVGNWTKSRIDKLDLTTGALVAWLGKAHDGSYGWHSANSGQAVAAPYYGSEIGAFNGIIDCNLYGNELYIVSYNSNPVLGVYDYTTGTYVRGFTHDNGHKPQEVIVDRFGNIIFSDNYEGSIKFFNKNLELTAKMQLGPGGDYFGVGDFAFDSHGYLYFTEQQKQKVYKLELIYK